MLAPGDKAPDFELPDQDDNPIRLSDLEGQTVVLYFNPKAETSWGRERILGASGRCVTERAPSRSVLRAGRRS